MQHWPANDPGEYRHQVTIMKQAPGTDKSGAVMSWVKFAACYAAIDPASARDMIRSGQTTSEVETPIRMNYLKGVTSDMQVWAANGSKYVVRGIINPQEMNVSLTLMCVALGLNQ